MERIRSGTARDARGRHAPVAVSNQAVSHPRFSRVQVGSPDQCSQATYRKVNEEATRWGGGILDPESDRNLRDLIRLNSTVRRDVPVESSHRDLKGFTARSIPSDTLVAITGPYIRQLDRLAFQCAEMNQTIRFRSTGLFSVLAATVDELGGPKIDARTCGVLLAQIPRGHDLRPAISICVPAAVMMGVCHAVRLDGSYAQVDPRHELREVVYRHLFAAANWRESGQWVTSLFFGAGAGLPADDLLHEFIHRAPDIPPRHVGDAAGGLMEGFLARDLDVEAMATQLVKTLAPRVERKHLTEGRQMEPVLDVDGFLHLLHGILSRLRAHDSQEHFCEWLVDYVQGCPPISRFAAGLALQHALGDELDRMPLLARSKGTEYVRFGVVLATSPFRLLELEFHESQAELRVAMVALGCRALVDLGGQEPDPADFARLTTDPMSMMQKAELAGTILPLAYPTENGHAAIEELLLALPSATRAAVAGDRKSEGKAERKSERDAGPVAVRPQEPFSAAHAAAVVHFYERYKEMADSSARYRFGVPATVRPWWAASLDYVERDIRDFQESLSADPKVDPRPLLAGLPRASRAHILEYLLSFRKAAKDLLEPRTTRVSRTHAAGKSSPTAPPSPEQTDRKEAERPTPVKSQPSRDASLLGRVLRWLSGG